ncbi:MAG: hypothetical protein R3C11_09040 [Planctomycetaceae bacterium]
MDDDLQFKPEAIRFTFDARRILLLMLLASCIISFIPGCSLFVMGGKMLFGDPMLTCSFTSQSGVNLKKSERQSHCDL